MQFFSSFIDDNVNIRKGLNLYGNKELADVPLLVEYEQFIDTITLISGESAKGKTEITANFIEFLCEYISSRMELRNNHFVYVLDMAPKRFFKKGQPIGGKISDFIPTDFNYSFVKFIDFENIIPARSQANSKEEVVNYVKENYLAISPEITKILENLKINSQQNEIKKYIIIINDLSIYLHHGGLQSILDMISLHNQGIHLTLFMNAYQGMVLLDDHGSNISVKEKADIKELKKYCDYSINLV